MQTIKTAPGWARQRAITVLQLTAGALLALALGSCGDDNNRCDRRFSDVPDIQACNDLGALYNCKSSHFSNCNRSAGSGTTTGMRTQTVTDEAACEQQAPTLAQQAATAAANVAAAQLAAPVQAEFDCGGFTFEDDFDYTVSFNPETSQCTVEVSVDYDVTVTACLICDPPKEEPRCTLSGCFECGDAPSTPTPIP